MLYFTLCFIAVVHQKFMHVPTGYKMSSQKIEKVFNHNTWYKIYRSSTLQLTMLYMCSHSSCYGISKHLKILKINPKNFGTMPKGMIVDNKYLVQNAYLCDAVTHYAHILFMP